MILLRRLRLALRQYNLTLELLELRLQLVQLAVRLLHDRRDVRERLAIGRDLPQLLRAGLYLQLLRTKEIRQSCRFGRMSAACTAEFCTRFIMIARLYHPYRSIAPLLRTANET